MDALFVYGTLCPGRSNAHILEAIGGDWLPGQVTGTYYQQGCGEATGFPGLVLQENGAQVEGWLFLSPHLQTHWPMLDEFEAGYDRVKVQVHLSAGDTRLAWVYQLQPESVPAT